MEEMIELLKQIQELAGVGIDALSQAAEGGHKGEGGPEGPPKGEGGPEGPPEGGPPPGGGKPGPSPEEGPPA